MNSQNTSRDDPRQATPCPQAGAGTGAVGGPGAEESSAHAVADEMTQAARAVMHPERHDTEWRYYHGAIRS